MIRQLSVLVENKPGSLMEVTSRLTEAHVNIRAVANFDAPDFGILRMVVDKPEEAKEYLTTRGYVVSVCLLYTSPFFGKVLKILRLKTGGRNYDKKHFT